jgi:hypothetical protein
VLFIIGCERLFGVRAVTGRLGKSLCDLQHREVSGQSNEMALRSYIATAIFFNTFVEPALVFSEMCLPGLRTVRARILKKLRGIRSCRK